MTDKLTSATFRADAADALKFLQTALGLDPNSSMTDHFPDGREWNHSTHAAKLQKIGDWLRAECYELASASENPANFMRMVDPLHTVGTRD